jgi:hypothetical protein
MPANFQRVTCYLRLILQRAFAVELLCDVVSGANRVVNSLDIMIVVAERLSAIALAEPVEDHADLYGRSAFNRYYYASYLITRDMLRQLDRSWTRTGHSNIPSLLTETVIKKAREELRRQQKLGGLGSGESASMRHDAHTAATKLPDLLKHASEVRRIADYETEQVPDHSPRLNGVVPSALSSSKNSQITATFCETTSYPLISYYEQPTTSRSTLCWQPRDRDSFRGRPRQLPKPRKRDFAA